MTSLRLFEKLCCGLGVLLLLSYAGAQVDAALGRAHALESFRAAQAATAAEPRVPPPLPPTDQSLWSPRRIEAYRDSLAASLDAPSGVLRIPRLELTVPVFEGTSELVLNRGVGRIEGTAELDGSGNVGIAGHRDGYFRGLKDIVIGDVIEVDTLLGLRNFRVAETLIVEPDAVEVLAAAERPMMTLVTCYPFHFVGRAPQRFIVRAVLDGTDSLSRQ